MASAGPVEPRGARGLAGLFGVEMLLAVWLPVAVIGALHYGTSAQHAFAHDIFRRLYYLPIFIAALRLGLLGGLSTAAVASLTYLPHAFLHPTMADPAGGLEKGLEIALYFVVGAVAGRLADLESRRRAELRDALAEQKRLSEQLERARRLSALGEVVAGMAHEIKNPLHSLSGTAEIVDGLIPKGTEERRMWEIHVAELGRLGRVAERFLSFARPVPFEPVAIDLRDVARRLADLLGNEARAKRVALEIALPDAPCTVKGDVDHLSQIGINVMVNGFKAMGEGGGRMRVEVGEEERPEGAFAYLRIENDGPRIPDDKLPQLFDPFFSGSDGSGLGLSISARIAEQHGGTIEARNEGLGVRFTLYLRREADPGSPPTRS
jgi:signal transduction histidine kinase